MLQAHICKRMPVSIEPCRVANQCTFLGLLRQALQALDPLLFLNTFTGMRGSTRALTGSTGRPSCYPASPGCVGMRGVGMLRYDERLPTCMQSSAQHVMSCNAAVTTKSAAAQVT